MKKSTMPVVQPLILSLALATIGTMGSLSAHAGDYSNAYIFGDSLSDGGAYGSRFTTNPGMTAAEYAALELGLSTTPAVTFSGVTGGNNYAQGGAMVHTAAPNALPMPVSSQVGLYLMQNAGKADANAVYFIQGGANDIFNGFQQGLSNAQMAGVTQQAALDLSTQIQTLSNAGAQTIMVQNLPNIGITPDFVGNPMTAAGGNALSQLFNLTLNQALTRKNLNVVVLDTYGLINEVAANPTTYGFTNATGKACTTTSSLYCSPATLVTPDAASNYVFADGVHPTTAAQKLSAQYALSVLKAPTQMSALGAAGLSSGQRYARKLMNQLPQAGERTWHTFADIGYAQTELGPAEHDTRSLLVGADRRMNEANTRVGLTLGYDSGSGHFGGNGGTFDLDETSVGTYVHQPFKRGHLMGYARFGRLSADTHRSIQLGAAQRVENGSTQGTHYSVGVQGNWQAGTWLNGKLTHGPQGRIGYEHVSLDGYDERGSNSTAMRFGDQSRKGWVMSVGYRVEGDLGRVKPYAMLDYEIDQTKANRMSAQLKNTRSQLSGNAADGDNGTRVQLGARMDVSERMHLNLALDQTIGKDMGQETGVQLGLHAQF